jgi:hypothetical protein
LALPTAILERLLNQFPTHAETLANKLGFSADCFTNREALGVGRLSHRCWLEPIVSQPAEIQSKAL